jgi:WD40 repeat protein
VKNIMKHINNPAAFVLSLVILTLSATSCDANFNSTYVESSKFAVQSNSGSVVATGRMVAARAVHAATLLSSGKVLVTGGMERNDVYTNSAELYDTATDTFAATGNMSQSRAGHCATRLSDGKVLVAGGSNTEWLASAEIYNPATGAFTPTGNMSVRRGGFTATLLPSGKVLIVGGYNDILQASAEIYDPATERFTSTGSMSVGRSAHTATLLPNGKVLIAGGGAGRNVLASAELYDPAAGKFTSISNMTVVRHKHAAALLPNGNVLIIGGSDNRDWRGRYANAEIYNAATGTFVSAANMNTTRFKNRDSVVLLNNETVFVAGGGEYAEIYNPIKNSFDKVSGRMEDARFYSTATLLPDGKVLVIGGYDNNIVGSAKAWLYKPQTTTANLTNRWKRDA